MNDESVSPGEAAGGDPVVTEVVETDPGAEVDEVVKVDQSGREYELATLVIAAEPDEMRSLRALAAVEAAAKGAEPDLPGTAQALLHDAVTSKLAELGLRWNPSPEAVERHVARAARRGGPVTRLMKTDAARRYTIVCLAVAVAVLLWGGYAQGWSWTGFQGNNQLWDWLQLLLLPVAIGTLPLWLLHPEYMSRTWRTAHVAAGLAFAGLVAAGYLVPLNWTGFPGNTLWDWLSLALLPVAVAIAPFLLSLLRSLRENQKRQAAIVVVAAVWVVSIVGGYAWRWTWTGYQGNTLWDWLGLLLLPLLVPTVLLPTVLRWVSVTTPSARPPGRATRVPARGPAG